MAPKNSIIINVITPNRTVGHSEDRQFALLCAYRKTAEKLLDMEKHSYFTLSDPEN